MTHQDRWLSVIDAISPKSPEDIDDLVSPFEPKAPKRGRMLFPPSASVPAPPYAMDDEETVAFGARITKDTPNRLSLAMTLAQMALEKGAEAIILSHVDDPELDRFGFRVERIGGEIEEDRAAAEAQVIRFWNIVFVI